jgi:hypothetical protein
LMLNMVNLIYQQALVDEEEKRKAKGPRKPHHYPSSACAVIRGKFEGACRRATWFSWKDVPRTDPMDAPALFKINTGNLVHAQLNGMLARALGRLGFVQEDVPGEEAEFHHTFEGLRYEHSGRMDNVFVHDGMRYKAEWKSTYGKGADFIKRDGPKVEHLLQCLLYLEQPEIKTDGTVLLYATRDSGFVFGYQVSKDPGGLLLEHMNSAKVEVAPVELPAVVGALQMLEEYVDGDVPPPKDYHGTWNCDYCPYRKLCDRTGE